MVVLFAIAISAARLFLPQLEDHRQALEAEASIVIGQPVTIERIKVGWHGWGPRLELHGVKLFDSSGNNELLSFATAYIDIALPNSIYERQLELGDLTLVGVALNVVRRSDGEYAIEGVNFAQQPLDNQNSGGMKWLLRQPRLALKDSQIRWRDENSGAHLAFSQTNLRIYNRGDRHLLEGSLVLPETMGGAVTVRIDALGDIDRLEELQVDFYFKGAQLRLAQWLVDRPALGTSVVNGSADLELWGRWQTQQLRELRGNLGLHDFYLAHDLEKEGDALVKQMPALAGSFVWQGDSTAWQLEVEHLQLGSGQPLARLHVAQWLKEGQKTVEIASSFARIETLTELAFNSTLLSAEWQQRLAQLQPRGDLRDAYLKLQLKPDGPPRYFMRARAENLGVKPWKKVPGFEGVDLNFNVDQQSGLINLNSVAASIDTQGLFRERLSVDTLGGQLAWQQGGDGWQIQLRQLNIGNQDLAAELQGSIELPAGDTSPQVDLQARIIRGNGAMTSRYLPVGIMNEKTVAWLDRGIVAGRVSEGAMVLRGPLWQFPFVDGSGRFDVSFKVADAIVDYAEGWPRIERAVADVQFAGNSMTVNGRSGNLFDTNIKSVTVAIADFAAHPAHLTLTGESRGATADLLRFLQQSPLHSHFGPLIDGNEASGNSTLGLNLDVPLAGDEPITTRGWVDFSNSAMNLKQYGVDLAAVNGKLAFTDHTVSAERLTAEVLGQPAIVAISTAKSPKNSGDFIIEAQGESRLSALSTRIELPIFPFLNGESEWQARLDLPRDNTAPTLQIRSSLQGMTVGVPAPIGKPSAEPRPLVLLAEFDSKKTVWKLDYGNTQLSGLFEQRHDDKGSYLQRAELRLGQRATLPTTAGFRVAGNLAHFDYKAWQPILFPDTAGDTDGNRAASARKDTQTTAVTEIDVGFDRATVFGQPLHKVQLQGQHTTNAWRFQVESRELVGKILLPDDWRYPLEMTLARLYITVADEDKSKKTAPRSVTKPVDPRKLPPLQINSADTRFGNAALGTMALLTTRRDSGMNIESLNLASATASAKLQGRWLQSGDGKQTSHLGGTIDIHNLGELLAGFGYVETVKKGAGSSVVDLNWSGAIVDPTVARLEGSVKFDIEDGQLLEVEPGAGRLFGLLSVQALPRRLTLDFSDLFGKGLAFDYMRGHFNFKNGNAVTNDFELDGPSAKVELQGRVGLVARDYDQQLHVMPHITSGLPLAGAVIGGVVVGAAVLLVEKLLKSKIDQATGIRYRVTGSWDAPVMVPQE